MGELDGIGRVLIANRGEIARRLIEEFRLREIETVVVFAEEEVDASWLEEADYSVYLNGRTVEETYLHPVRVVSAAVDAGCDAIHPGYCFLAEHVDFYQGAASANLPILSCDLHVLPKVVDQVALAASAREVAIPLIPASGLLDKDEDGIAAGAQLGVPLFVKARAGKALRRVSRLEELPAAVAQVREAAQRATGVSGVYLERAVDRIRQISTVVVADRHGTAVYLGHVDGSLQVGFRTWVEELGQVVDPVLHAKLGEAAVRLAKRVSWVGVGTVKWAVTRDGGWYLLGFSPRLTTGYNLVEAVFGVNLVDAQLMALAGEQLPWTQEDAQVSGRHGVQVRVLHGDPKTGSRPLGTLEVVRLPSGVLVTRGVDEGAVCTANTDPLLLKLTATAPTRQAAFVQAKAALADLEIRGVVNNAEALSTVLGLEDVWDGTYDTGTLASVVAR